MAQLEKSQLHLGYIPLLDCVALLWAKQRGFFEEVGLDVSLVKEASWASLRDRLAFGFLDAAHCLSAMLPTAALAQDQLGIPLQTPLVLSYNSAFISLSQKLCYALDIKKLTMQPPLHRNSLVPCSMNSIFRLPMCLSSLFIIIVYASGWRWPILSLPNAYIYALYRRPIWWKPFQIN